MSTKTKKFGIIEILKEMFGENKVEEYSYEDNESKAKLPKELQDTLSSINVEEEKMEKGFNITSRKGANTKTNPETEKAMRAKHNQVVQEQKRKKEQVDREIGE